ncbi:hypothetical protein OsI_27563 [Oryza sativa Indica Group]|uniref:Uncharacterized protein n=1 Tax=Oryza sativa subsp. indica TaxID=39946 RepID=A2YQJ8_ORYSI|nr:hypothetical protein OsI_27563 [Oryza sativa Indica Group]
MTPDDMAAACLMKCPVRSSIRGLNLQWGNEHQMNMHLNIVQIDCYMVPMDSNFGASRPTSLTGSAGDPPPRVLSDITNLSAAELRRKRARERYALLSVDEKEARNKKAREKRRQKEECQGGN